MTKKRYSIITWNNPKTDSKDKLMAEPLQESPTFTWVKGQIEIGEEKGTPHIQAVIYNRKGLNFKNICQKFEGLVCKAYDENAEAMIKYITKRDTKVPGTEFESGMAPEVGKNSDKAKKMEEIVKDIQQHLLTTQVELFEKYGSTYMKNYKAIGHCLQLSKPKQMPNNPFQDEPTIQVTWIYGNSGLGKTRRVHAYCWQKQVSLYTKRSDTGQWWDDYQGEDVVLFDDFRQTDMRFHELLQLLDPYRTTNYRIQCKGGFKELTSTMFFFTTDKHPKLMFKRTKQDPNSWKQLARRITTLLQCDEEFTGEVNAGLKRIVEPGENKAPTKKQRIKPSQPEDEQEDSTEIKRRLTPSEMEAIWEARKLESKYDI